MYRSGEGCLSEGLTSGPGRPSVGLSGQLCTSSLPPVEGSVSLTRLHTAEPESGNSSAVVPAVAPVLGLASQIPLATGHGAWLWERDLESFGLPNKRTVVRRVPLGGEEMIQASPASGQDPTRRLFHNFLLLLILLLGVLLCLT